MKSVTFFKLMWSGKLCECCCDAVAEHHLSAMIGRHLCVVTCGVYYSYSAYSTSIRLLPMVLALSVLSFVVVFGLS